MAYTRTNWVDDAEPPIDAAHLIKIEQGIFEAHEGVDGAAQIDHSHDYAPASHLHHNYQALLETNLDLLMRGILYTRAQPFSQSFTFSGDGTRTAFKIPRSSVNQQGWVRGSVSATVGGAAATGTYNIHTQTFTFGTAPASGTGNVVISSTDVVPYQGMAASVDTVELRYSPGTLLVITSGTGASTSHTHNYFPASVKLPAEVGTDDALLNDIPAAAGCYTATSLLSVPHSAYQSNGDKQMLVGERRALTANPSSTTRGRYGITDNPIVRWEGVRLTSSIPHITAFAGLVRVSPVSGSSFEQNELALAVAQRQLNSTGTLAMADYRYPGAAFDLFRLSGGPITEAA